MMSDSIERHRPYFMDKTLMIPLLYLTEPFYGKHYPKSVIYGKAAVGMGAAIAKKLGDDFIEGKPPIAQFLYVLDDLYCTNRAFGLMGSLLQG